MNWNWSRNLRHSIAIHGETHRAEFSSARKVIHMSAWWLPTRHFDSGIAWKSRRQQSQHDFQGMFPLFSHTWSQESEYQVRHGRSLPEVSVSTCLQDSKQPCRSLESKPCLVLQQGDREIVVNSTQIERVSTEAHCDIFHSTLRALYNEYRYNENPVITKWFFHRFGWPPSGALLVIENSYPAICARRACKRTNPRTTILSIES